MQFIVILGSGGHSTEMLCLLSKLNMNFLKKIVFIHNSNDSLSKHKCISFMRTCYPQCHLQFISIPRPRHVFEENFRILFTFFYSFLATIFKLVAHAMLTENNVNIAINYAD